MSYSVENGEKRNGYTPREVVSGFSKINNDLMNLAASGVQPVTLQMIRREILDIVRASLPMEDDDNQLINPLANYKRAVNPSVAENIKSLVIPRGEKTLRKPGLTVQETKLTGLYFLETYPDEVSRQSYLVGDNEVKRLFQIPISPEDIFPSKY